MLNEKRIKANERMTTLSEVTYSDFVMLLSTLKKLSKAETNSEKMVDACKKLDTFFPYVDAVQDMYLNSAAAAVLDCRPDAEQSFNTFKGMYPDIIVDREGRTKPERKKFWQLRLETLEKIYGDAVIDNLTGDSKKRAANIQIRKARELSSLLDRKDETLTNFSIILQLFIKKFGNEVAKKDIELCRSYMLEICETDRPLLMLLNDILKTKKFQTSELYFTHFLSRVELAYLELKDEGKIENTANLEFLAKLKSI